MSDINPNQPNPHRKLWRALPFVLAGVIAMALTVINFNNIADGFLCVLSGWTKVGNGACREYLWLLSLPIMTAIAFLFAAIIVPRGRMLPLLPAIFTITLLPLLWWGNWSPIAVGIPPLILIWRVRRRFRNAIKIKLLPMISVPLKIYFTSAMVLFALGTSGLASDKFIQELPQLINQIQPTIAVGNDIFPTAIAAKKLMRNKFDEIVGSKCNVGNTLCTEQIRAQVKQYFQQINKQSGLDFSTEDTLSQQIADRYWQTFQDNVPVSPKYIFVIVWLPLLLSVALVIKLITIFISLLLLVILRRTGFFVTEIRTVEKEYLS